MFTEEDDINDLLPIGAELGFNEEIDEDALPSSFPTERALKVQ